MLWRVMIKDSEILLTLLRLNRWNFRRMLKSVQGSYKNPATKLSCNFSNHLGLENYLMEREASRRLTSFCVCTDTSSSVFESRKFTPNHQLQLKDCLNPTTIQTLFKPRFPPELTKRRSISRQTTFHMYKWAFGSTKLLRLNLKNF